MSIMKRNRSLEAVVKELPMSHFFPDDPECASHHIYLSGLDAINKMKIKMKRKEEEESSLGYVVKEDLHRTSPLNNFSEQVIMNTVLQLQCITVFYFIYFLCNVRVTH